MMILAQLRSGRRRRSEDALEGREESRPDGEEDGSGQYQEDQGSEHLERRLGPGLAQLIAAPEPYLPREDLERDRQRVAAPLRLQERPEQGRQLAHRAPAGQPLERLFSRRAQLHLPDRLKKERPQWLGSQAGA